MKEGYDEITMGDVFQDYNEDILQKYLDVLTNLDKTLPNDPVSLAKQDATVESILNDAFHGKYSDIAKELAQASLLFGMNQIIEQEDSDGITTEEMQELAVAINAHLFFEIHRVMTIFSDKEKTKH